MARKQFLQNVRTTKEYSPKVIAQAELKYGEIAVFRNTEKPSLGIKVGENTYAQFKDSEAVTAEISSAKTELSTTIGQNTADISELSKKFGDYATSAETVAADTKTLSDAKAYTDLLKATVGETYNEETLAGLKSEINSLKGNSDTSVGALASRVSTAEGKITTLEDKVGDNTKGLVKNVADLKTEFGKYATSADTVAADTKTLSDAKSYTDSQINAIKGGETTATLSSLKSDVDNQGSAISGITNGDKLNDFSAVEKEINSKISSVYRVKGSCTYEELLHKSGQIEGDVWNVTDAHGNVPAGTNYVWAKGEGETTATWDALGGTIDLSPYATTATTKGLESRLDTAESDIKTLTAATGTLNTSITTIQGWKINGSAITSDTVLNGTNLKVDTTAGAKTLNEAIADAAQSGSSANNAFTAWTAGTYSENQAAINTKFGEIDAYTVNGIKISEKPVLTGENVLVGGTSEDKAKNLNSTIAEAKAAGTTAQTNLTTLKGTYSGTLETLSSKVDKNEQNITKLRTDVDGVSATTITAVQTITVTNTETNKITAEKTGTNVTFNFDNMVIDCGEF